MSVYVDSPAHYDALRAELDERTKAFNIVFDRCKSIARERDEAVELLRALRELAEYWFNREDRSGYSRDNYMSWRWLGYSSSAYREVVAFLSAATAPCDQPKEGGE